MADRTVTVKLRLDSDQYKREARETAGVTKDLDKSTKDVDASVFDLSKDTNKASSGMKQMRNEAGRTRTDFRGLNDEIERTKRGIQDLARRYNATGDESLFGDFTKQRQHLAFLTQLRKQLGDVDDQAKKFPKFQAPDFGGLESFATSPWSGLAHPAVLGAGAGLIGGAGSAAVLAGTGLLGVAGGAALGAAGSKDVQSTYRDLFQRISAQGQDAASSFTKPLLDSAVTFGTEWEHVRGELKSDFANIAPELTKLSSGFAGFVDKSLPGLGNLLNASKPLLGTLARELPHIGGAFSDFANDIAAAGPDADKFFADFLHSAEGAIEVTGKFLEYGAKIYGLFSDIAHFYLPLPSDGHAKLVGFKDDINGVAQGLHDVDTEARKVSDDFDKLFGNTMDVQKSMIAYKQGLADLKQTLAEGTHTLDINTQAGRDHAQALLDQAELAERIRKAEIEAAGGVNANRDAVMRANIEYLKNVGALRNQAEAAGYSADQLADLTQQWFALLKAPDIYKQLTISEGIGTKAIPAGPGRTLKAGIGHRATGGPVYPGSSYDVGEAGTERLTMFAGGGGYVTPLTGFRSASSSGGTQVVVRQPLTITLNGRALHEGMVEFAVNTGRTPAALWPDSR